MNKLIFLMLLAIGCKEKDVWQKKVDSYANGKPKREYLLHNGKIDSTMITYDKDGFKSGLLKFKNDKQNGESTIYFPSGKIKENQFYIDGKREGLFIGYFENGNKSMEISFKDDKISGIFKKWAEDGKLVTESNFSKDSLTFTGQHLGIGRNTEEKK
jgi:uncharacterized protein